MHCDFHVECNLVKEDQLSLMDLRSNETLAKIIVEMGKSFKCWDLINSPIRIRDHRVKDIINVCNISSSCFSCLLVNSK